MIVELAAKRHMRFHEIQDFIVAVIILLGHFHGRMTDYMRSKGNPRLVGGVVDTLAELGLAADIELDDANQTSAAIAYAKEIGLHAFSETINGHTRIHVALADAARS